MITLIQFNTQMLTKYKKTLFSTIKSVVYLFVSIWHVFDYICSSEDGKNVTPSHSSFEFRYSTQTVEITWNIFSTPDHSVDTSAYAQPI